MILKINSTRGHTGTLLVLYIMQFRPAVIVNVITQNTNNTCHENTSCYKHGIHKNQPWYP